MKILERLGLAGPYRLLGPRDEAEHECFELPWPASWTLWIVCAISVVVGFAIGWVLA